MENKAPIEDKISKCSNEEDSEELEEISDGETENEVNVTSMDKNTNLHFSAAMGIRDSVLQDVESPDQKIDAENFMGWTPLMMAVRNGNIECVKILLEKGADVTKKNKLGVNIFVMSVANGDVELMEIILKHMLRGGISRNRIQENFSPVSLAILFKKTHLIHWLIDQGFDLNVATWKTNLSPLMFAAVASNDTIISMIEARGANKNHKNFMGLNYRDIMLWRKQGLHHLKKLVVVKQEPKPETDTILPKILISPTDSIKKPREQILQLKIPQQQKNYADICSPRVTYRVPNNTPCAHPADQETTIHPSRNKSVSMLSSQCSNIDLKFSVQEPQFKYPLESPMNKVHQHDLLQSFSKIQTNNPGIQQQNVYQTPSNMHYPNYLPVMNSPYGVSNVGNPVTPVMLVPYQNFVTVGDHPQNSPMNFIPSPQNFYQNTSSSPQFYFPSQVPQELSPLPIENPQNHNGFYNNSVFYQFFSPSRNMYTFTAP